MAAVAATIIGLASSVASAQPPGRNRSTVAWIGVVGVHFTYGRNYTAAEVRQMAAHATPLTLHPSTVQPVQLHEVAIGGYSRQWQLTENIRHSEGSYDAQSLDAWYACAINVSGSPDHYCVHGADPSQVDQIINPGETLYKYFEYNTYKNTEYPMVGIGVQFTHVYVRSKFRGWDTCASKSATKLCPKSGDGH